MRKGEEVLHGMNFSNFELGKIIGNYTFTRTCYVLLATSNKISGWPSGLRPQTQVKQLVLHFKSIRAFWFTYVGVGSNPTPDKIFFIIALPEKCHLHLKKHFNLL